MRAALRSIHDVYWNNTRQIFSYWKTWTFKKFGDYDIVKLGKVSLEERDVPDTIMKPEYYYTEMESGDTTGIPEIKNAEDIAKMRKSCKLAANVLKSCSEIVKVGVTTDEIDAFVHNKIIQSGAYPSPLRYAGFPKSVCTSVNNVACHGIPDDRRLVNGDIINIDITVFLDGYHGDTSKMFLVGDVDEQGKHLVSATEECLYGAIKECGPGNSLNRIGMFIHTFAKSKGLMVVPAFIGHGIGRYFHGPPEILHFYNTIGGLMHPGMTFTIEPILTQGGPEIEIEVDGWTAMTVDNARTAQFEHTILITEEGAEILTLPELN